jgi:hypothetical protein
VDSAWYYDEELVLFDYARDHTNLLSETERRVAMSLIWRQKLRASPNSQIGHKLTGIGDPEIEAALAVGEVTFRRRVALRLLADETATAHINRCPRCARIVRAPKARQCLWCGHDWHG